MADTTLLDLVQGILSDVDGDEVNDISHTIESEQVARILRDEYETICDEFDLKVHQTYDKLNATSPTTPCLMTRPDGFHSIESVRYDHRLTAGGDPKYKTLTFRDPEHFMEVQNGLTASDTNVEQMTLPDSGYVINIYNDRDPQYWTILENYDYVVFDAYDYTKESNLQESKTLARGERRRELVLANTTVPDLPENLMLLLKNRARSMYFDLYKDGVTPGVARRERYSEVRAQRKKYMTKRLQDQRTGPDYGRKRR